MEEYQVYAHMNRQGYRLLRSNPENHSSRELEEPPEKRPRMMGQDVETAHIPRIQPMFQPCAADKSDFERIPHFEPGAESIVIQFHDVSLLPGVIGTNRQSSYTIRRDIFTWNPRPDDVEKCCSMEEDISDRNLSDCTAVPQEIDRSDDPLYQGETKPLLDGSFLDG